MHLYGVQNIVTGKFINYRAYIAANLRALTSLIGLIEVAINVSRGVRRPGTFTPSRATPLASATVTVTVSRVSRVIPLPSNSNPHSNQIVQSLQSFSGKSFQPGARTHD